MRRSIFSLLFLIRSPSLLCSAQTAQPPGAEGISDLEMTKKLINYWADFSCFKFSDNSEPNIKEQCKEACFPGGMKSTEPISSEGHVSSSQTCWFNGPESDFRTGKPLTEEQKNDKSIKTITTGYCTCNDPIISITGDFFIMSAIKIGEILNDLLCPALHALDIIVEIGSAALPGIGKAITTGMKVGIQTAKTFRHKYNAQDAALEWATMFTDFGFGLATQAGCGSFLFSKTQLMNMFLDFANAPDELIPAINYDQLPCPKGKKASQKCKDKNGDDEEDPPSKTEENKDPQSKTEINSEPTRTSEEEDNNRSPSASDKDDQATQTSNQPSSFTTATAKPTAKVDCAAIGRRGLKDFLEEESPSLQERWLGKREVRLTLQRRRLEGRGYEFKPGDSCKGKSVLVVNSKKYPTAGDPAMSNAVAYGFNKVDDCNDYAWGEQKMESPDVFDTEHVLEWRLVHGFFTKMNDHPDFKGGFNNPEPEVESKKNLDFCTYCTQSWAWTPSTGGGIPNPDPNTPAPGPGLEPEKQTPLQWLAEAYPFIDGSVPGAKRAYADEFILLQKVINSQAKTNMFHPTSQIYNAKKMDKLIRGTDTEKERRTGKLRRGEPHEQPRLAVQRLRAVVGAYLYLKEPKVNNIFIAQVDRIGAQLENIENSLAIHSKRKVKQSKPDDQGVIHSRVLYYEKWVPQKLKEKWFEYMDDVYRNADEKAQKLMKEFIEKLEDEYNEAKMIKQADVDKEKDEKKQDRLRNEKKLREDMQEYVPKLKAEWTKARDWPKPKWNA